MKKGASGIGFRAACACFSGLVGVCLGFAFAYFATSKGDTFPYYFVWISGGLCGLLGFVAKESFVSAMIEVVLGLPR
jgi:hypothetical protein